MNDSDRLESLAAEIGDLRATIESLQNSIAESQSQVDDGSGPPSKYEQLCKVLEHGRDIFKYQAGQRLTSLRYAFVVFVFLTGAYVGAVSDADRTDAQIPIAFAVALLGILFAIVFWILDIRNVQLVETCENLLRRAEKELAETTNIEETEIFAASDDTPGRWFSRYGNVLVREKTEQLEEGKQTDGSAAKQASSDWRKFMGVMPVMFSVFILIGVAGLIYAGIWQAQEKSPPKTESTNQNTEPRKNVSVHAVAEEDFEDHVGQVFTLSQSGPHVELTLTEVREYDHFQDSVTRPLHVRQEPFSLLFLAEQGELLRSGIYELDHPELGDLNLFLHEVGADENIDTVHYQVVFN